MLVAFVAWTVAVLTVNVSNEGPESSPVGFSALNSLFHRATGVNMTLYTLTDLLSVIPLLVVVTFGLVGLCQWIKRRSILRVDYSIIILGMFYVAVMAAFAFFEVVVINYRPILIEGRQEASYPSSTTMLVLCVMPTAVMQLNSYVKNKVLKNTFTVITTAFTAFMVTARLICGVHWLTDIVGGILLSAGLVLLYRYFVSNKPH